MRFLIFIVCFWFILNAIGQKNESVSLKFNPTIKSNTFIIDKMNNDSLVIESLKFYITNIKFIKNKNVVWEEKDSYHLLDAKKPISLTLNFKINKEINFDAIQFLIGTDSLTNVSGVMGGDLDPTKGMYWAWNSGYINFKLEGKYKAISFKYHIGGYASPYQTVQKIELKTKRTSHLTIGFDVANFLNQVNLKKPKIMSPGKEAQDLSRILSSLFYIYD